MDAFALTTLAALLVEAAAGYPDRLYRAVGHPVTRIGALIDALDRRLNDPAATAAARRRRGVLAIGVVVAVAAAAGALVAAVAAALPFGALVAAVPASSLLAQRSLHAHVAAVAAALERDGLDAGRAAVGRIVGRDTAALDEAGVCRAAIESLAENASDGVVASALWLLVLGLPGALAYKAINTADSMIGHRTARHEAFGAAAARLDDAVNLPASRLTGLLFALAAPAVGGSARAALRAVARDAPRHRSPNAGWPEAAAAGALGLSLGGPRAYAGVPLADAATMGDGRRDATPADIRRALRLFRVADALFIALVAAVAALLWL